MNITKNNLLPVIVLKDTENVCSYDPPLKKIITVPFKGTVRVILSDSLSNL